MIDEGDPDGKRMRLEAARLVRTLPDPFEAQLSRLLEDRDPEVAKYAIEAVGKIPPAALRAGAVGLARRFGVP